MIEWVNITRFGDSEPRYLPVWPSNAWLPFVGESWEDWDRVEFAWPAWSVEQYGCPSWWRVERRFS